MKNTGWVAPPTGEVGIGKLTAVSAGADCCRPSLAVTAMLPACGPGAGGWGVGKETGRASSLAGEDGIGELTVVSACPNCCRAFAGMAAMLSACDSVVGGCDVGIVKTGWASTLAGEVGSGKLTADSACAKC